MPAINNLWVIRNTATQEMRCVGGKWGAPDQRDVVAFGRSEKLTMTLPKNGEWVLLHTWMQEQRQTT